MLGVRDGNNQAANLQPLLVPANDVVLENDAISPALAHPMSRWQRFKARVYQSVGIFPAPTISSVKSFPVLGSIVRSITGLLGFEKRTASQVFNQDFKNLPGISATEFYIRPNTENQLESFSFESTEFNTLPPQDQYYRIHASSNTGNCSRFFGELSALSQANKNLKTITYNHPDVEKSKGSVHSHRHVVDAIVSQVQDLRKNGIDPKNIIVTGFSIGAASTLHAYAELKKVGINGVKIYADRTFSSMEKVIEKKLELGFFGRLFSRIFNIKKQLKSVDWDMDPAAQYANIPAADRSLVSVKLRKLPNVNVSQVATFNNKTGHMDHHDAHDDLTIPYAPSLHKGVRDSYQETKEILYKLKALTDYTHRDFKKLVAELKLKANDAIIYNAALRLEVEADKEALICQAIVALKSQRLDGTAARDAHNESALVINCRGIQSQKHNSKWLAMQAQKKRDGKSTDNYSLMLERAYVSSGMKEQAKEAKAINATKTAFPQMTAANRFTMFFKAIVSNNTIHAQQKAKEKREVESKYWEEFANSL